MVQLFQSKNRKYLPFLILIGIVLCFFYKTIIFGKVPFPGDLMLSEYVPFRHTSYSGYAAGGVPSKGQYFDVARELYPWKTLVVDAFRHRQLPLWNPYNFSGTPLLANYQSQALYPLGIIYFFLPQKIAWTVMVIIQPILGAVFFYLFATEIGLSAIAALSAALLFNFSSFASVWMEFTTVWHTILWLPFLLFLVERGIKQKKIFRGQKICFMFALFSSITGGHPQDFINTFLFFIIYICFRFLSLPGWKKKEKMHFIFTEMVPVITIPFLLAMPQLLPTIGLFGNSSRVPHDYQQILTTMLFQWWQAPLIVIQDFFGNPATRTYLLSDTYVGKAISIGVSGFILAVFGCIGPKKSWHVRFSIFVAAALIILNFNTPLASLFYRFPIPLLSTGTPTRNLFLFALSMSVLAGYGIDAVRTMNHRKLLVGMVISITVMMTLWIICLCHPVIGATILVSPSTKRSLILGSVVLLGILASIALGRKKQVFFLGITAVIICELFYSFIKFNPFVPQSFLYPQNDVLTFLQQHAGIDRYWGYGTARMESNLNSEYGLYSADGTDPLNLSWYNRFVQSANDGNIARTFTRTTRSDVALAPGYGEKDLPNNRYRLRILDLLGVRYVLDRIDNPKDNNTFPASLFQPVFSTKDGYTIYENKNALPRIFLADHIQTYTTDAEFERIFFDPSFDTGNTVLVSAKELLPAVASAKKKDVSILSYTPDAITVRTDTDAPQMLFLSDTYDTGWKATIDGNQTQIYRTNYAFRSVSVPTGTHTIIFTYMPDTYTIGLLVSAAGLLLAVFLLSIRSRK